MPPRIAILGGGITGLSVATFLKQLTKCQIKILEASSRVGGWVHSTREKGQIFEHGPRSLQTGAKAYHTLDLVSELGLEDKLLPANPKANVRYFYVEGNIQKLPSEISGLLQSSLIRRALPRLLLEPFVSKRVCNDSSIHSFIQRRFGSHVADRLFAPLVTGIYAGNTNSLSIRSCFPSLFEYEQKYGSVILGLLLSRSPEDKSTISQTLKSKGTRVFSLKGGLQTLIDALQDQHADQIITSTKVQKIEFLSDCVKIYDSSGKSYTADHVFSCLPSFELAGLISDKQISNSLLSIPYINIAVVNLVYPTRVLSDVSGFGYLVAPIERSPILGVSFDSDNFPSHAEDSRSTMLTVMIGGDTSVHSNVVDVSKASEEDLVRIAIESLDRHLGIQQVPTDFKVKVCLKAIPAYPVGHYEIVKMVQDRVARDFRRLSLCGSWVDGVGVNACVANGYHAVSDWLSRSNSSKNRKIVWNEIKP